MYIPNICAAFYNYEIVYISIYIYPYGDFWSIQLTTSTGNETCGALVHFWSISFGALLQASNEIF